MNTGIGAARPGVPMAAVCRAINRVLEAEGYGEYCHPPHIRRRGHGLGFGSIRPGDVSLDNDTMLDRGMVFMIHPNQHLPETGYLLCGEPVLLTADGAEPLTRWRSARFEPISSLDYGCRADDASDAAGGPSDWDGARMPQGGVRRAHRRAVARLPVGRRRDRLRRPGPPRRARLSHPFHAQARGGAGADPARGRADAPGRRRRQHAASREAADLDRDPVRCAMSARRWPNGHVSKAARRC